MLAWLYVPGDRPDRFEKAVAAGADAVILDLEDAVAPGRKAYAAAAVAEFLSEVPASPCEVRVQDGRDVASLVGLPGLAGLWLPKIESPAQIREYAQRAPGVPLRVLIETASGVEKAALIAAADPAVASVALGEADLGSDLHIEHEEGFAWMRSRLVVAARAAGLPSPPMSVYAVLNDDEGLRASCAAGRRLGLRGRSAIHPQQVPVIIEAFLPRPAEVEAARELLAAFAGAADADGGTVVLPDGRFVDRAMVGAARDVVDLAARYGTGSR